jgi:hypothetical protein
MTCARVTLDNGFTAIVCGPAPERRPCRCGKAAEFVCDWKVERRGKAATCDAPVCAACSTKPAEGKDLCPTHGGLWLQRQAANTRPAQQTLNFGDGER